MTVTLYKLNAEPIKGAVFTFSAVLTSQADTDIFKTTPTLAAGDITVSKDGGNFANIGTLPTQIQTTGVLPVALTADEMNADRVFVLFHDVAGAEWQDVGYEIFTKAAVNVGVSDYAGGAVASVTNPVTVGTNNDKTGYGLADNAITAAKIATDAVSEIADGAWDEMLAGHALAGSAGKALTDAGGAGGATPASLWAYESRTLTQSAAAVASVVAGTSITIIRGDTLTIVLTNVGATTGYVSIDFTVKRSKDDTDAKSVICIRKNASGFSDGLLYLNGAVPSSAAAGSITIDDGPTGDLTITLNAASTALLAIAAGLYWDIQYIFAGSISTKTEGKCDIVGDVRRAVS